MEDREENSHGTAIPKKSRSLDLKSLYKSKVTKETPKKSLKRKGSHPGGVDEKRNKKKKTRKEVSLSSLENADVGLKKVDEECQKGPGSGRQDLCGQRLEPKQGLSSNTGLNRGSLNFDENVHIPKRRRDFVGRKKFEVGPATKLAGQASSTSGHGDQIPKLSSDDLDRRIESSKIKQKRNFDEFKESRSNSAVNSGDSSLKKSRKKDRKQKALAPDRNRVAKEVKPLIDGSKISDYLREDEEENLEENAARMLSSRFDPNYTGFCSSSKPSTLPSSNGLSFLLSSSRNIDSCGSKSQSGSESASVDTAGRVLRPRKQYKEKGNSRKRRHFYEISLGDLDEQWILNQRIKVFWPLDQSWYHGLVDDYNKETKCHHIKYDDREEEWINLQTERFKLLLLPSEVRGKSGKKRAVRKNRSSGQQKGSLFSKERQTRDVSTEDDNCGESCMDTEPIISWLARSSLRFKSSAFHSTKKKKTSVMLPSTASSLLCDEPVKVQKCLAESSPREGKSSLSRDSVSEDKLGDNFGKNSPLQSFNCPKEDKQPIVYFRRRFRKPTPISPHISEDKHVDPTASCSISFDPVVGGLMDVKEPNDGRVETGGPLWFTHNVGVSKIFFDTSSAAFKFDLNYPIQLVLNDLFKSENLWLLRAILLLQYGTVMTLWPRVHLEMLFVDNVVGLRFLLFEGCLMMAAAFVFCVLRLFHQPADEEKYIDLQLPVTSIRFRFSSVYGIKKPLVFAFYNFSSVKNSKWMYLDSELKRHCLLSKQLHLSECTYDNIQAFQNQSSEYPISSIRGNPLVKVMQKRTRPGINIMGISRELSQADTSQSSDAGKRKIPPFSLSFSAAPTFFLSLHLKLLIKKSVAHISFCDNAPVDDQEDSGLMTDDCSSIDDCSIRNAEFNVKKNMMTMSKDAVRDELTCAESDLLIGPSNCSDQILSENYQNIDLSAGRTSGLDSSERPPTVQLPEWQSRHSNHPFPSNSLTDKIKADDGSHSFLCDLSVRIPSVDQFEKPCDVDLRDAQHSSDFSWNTNGGVILSPNPTAPRSSWHRNRNNSSSFGFQSHGWSDVKADSLHNGFSSGPKKPRTQVSYSVPLSGHDYNSRHRSHYQRQRGLPHKRIRKANEKKSLDVARSPEKNLESLSCDANVLITLGDKGWRESGARVVLELFDHNEWKLSVKLAGITRYSYKAHQFLQPGSTNRYTHAMLWKGGKDWILEFPDRSQWAVFKEMHEECYNQNIRAASVKNIPIPGVVLIEENFDNESEAAFVRSSKYFRQVETDVEMALNPLHVLYDMDSEDEQWILTTRNSEKDNGFLDGISDKMFEKTIDMFEKAAYAQQRDQFTPTEIEELTVDVGPLCVTKTIYEHWQQKREKKGMPLIRHFQPPLWERYQHELREWEIAMTKNNIPISNGCLDKIVTLEKPAMFAFCLKPRGLEVPNKGSKHRSQKKISVSGHSNSILYEQDGFHTYGRRFNGLAYGDEKFAYPGHNYDSVDDSPLPQTSSIFSPQDAGSMGYYSINNSYERNHIPKYDRHKSRKFGSFGFHNDSWMTSYNQRISWSGRRNGDSRWNVGYYDLAGHRQYLLDCPQRHGIEQIDGPDHDEFRKRDALGAAQHAVNMAKLKRERAQRLLYRADLAIHKAVVALMTAEAMKASEDSNGDG
ncbi:Histone-lysine N-methyltransferase ATX2 [Spatholobus suberectus]|nr:Histone-lysine N-methyltransferase ATX2 [Spatholobus suberectus]